MKNKKGGFTDIFIFMIFSLVILVVFGIMIYVSSITNAKLHEALDPMKFGDVNGSTIVTNSMGMVDNSFQSLYWISWFLMGGMVFAIFIGSYMVRTKPVYFVPYVFVSIIAVIVSVVVSNAYETIVNDPTMNSIFVNFVGANFIMSKLPIWVTVISFIGAVIMFANLGRGSTQNYGGSSLYG